MKLQTLGLIPALLCFAGLTLPQHANAQRPGNDGGAPPPQFTGGPIPPGFGNPTPPDLSGSGNPPPYLTGPGNPPPPPVSGSDPVLSGSGNPPPPWVSGSDPVLSGSGNPPPLPQPYGAGPGNPPPPGVTGSGGPIVSGSGNPPPPPWAAGLPGGSTESLTLGIAFVPTSGTTTTAMALLNAVSVDGTDHGTLDVRTSGLPGGTYTVSAVAGSGTTPITLGTFNVQLIAGKTGTAHRPSGPTNTWFGRPGGIAFPSGLDPFTLASLAISDSNATVLFTADLTTVSNGVYCASTPLVTGTSLPDATGRAQIRASAKAGVVTGILAINAKGLTPGTAYTYAINGTDIGTVTSGSSGGLRLTATENATNGTLPSTVDLFDVSSVTILDGDGNVILSVSF